MEREVTEHELYVVDVIETDKQKIRLRVVSWNLGLPKLEKRSYYKDKNSGEWKTGKAVGMDLADWSLIHNNPKKLKKVEDNLALSKKDEIEERAEVYAAWLKKNPK